MSISKTPAAADAPAARKKNPAPAPQIDGPQSPQAAVGWAILGAVLLIALWEGSVRLLSLPAYILPKVSDILIAVFTQRAQLFEAAQMTVMEAISGFALGSLAGVSLAVIMTMIPAVRRVMLPAAIAINSVPVVAYAPLVLLWFGIGPQSKIVMVTLAVGFTIFLSALAGLGQIDQRAVALMRSFGGNRFSILWRLRIPAALPLIAAGMRVSTVRSMIVAIVTEMLGATGGLGWTIFQAVLQIDFVQVWSAIFVASAASMIFFGAVGYAERKIIYWK
ncbi:ABC transporter permease [Herbaspirillum lusitanum]|uniref:ABC transporter permease n=1 Tax=Herbaspirillum lusitanum TaxID=213312 RepID=A0ABW9A7V1_9BURK